MGHGTYKMGRDLGMTRKHPYVYKGNASDYAIRVNVAALANYEIKLANEGDPKNFTVDWGDGSSDVITVYNQVELVHNYTDAGDYDIVCVGHVGELAGLTDSGITRVYNWGSAGFATTISGNRSFRFKYDLEFWANDLPAMSSFTSGNQHMYNSTFGVFTRAKDWPISGMSTFSTMFRNSDFNENINTWNTSGKGSFSLMFMNNQKFNQPLNNWDVSSVTSIASIFQLASVFNQPLNNWDVSLCTGFVSAFRDAVQFNQSLNTWVIRNTATPNVSNMFEGASKYNQPMDNWDTSAIIIITSMFLNASSFDQDLSNWDIGLITTATQFLEGSAFSDANYDLLLVAWEAKAHQLNVPIHFGSASYSAGAPATAHAALISDGWTITDGGPA